MHRHLGNRLGHNSWRIAVTLAIRAPTTTAHQLATVIIRRRQHRQPFNHQPWHNEIHGLRFICVSSSHFYSFIWAIKRVLVFRTKHVCSSIFTVGFSEVKHNDSNYSDHIKRVTIADSNSYRTIFYNVFRLVHSML